MSKMRLAIVLAYSLLAAAPMPAVAQMGGGMSMGGGGEPSRRDPTAAYNAGVEALQASNYEEAIRQFRLARRASPNDAQINYALGVAYVGVGNNAEAKTSFERATRAENAPPNAWLQLGLVSIELGDRENAVAQQTALQQQVQACGAQCDAQRRGQLQNAHDQLARALAR